MPNLTSSVLLIDHPRPSEIQFGADIVNDFAEARLKIASRIFQVVVIPFGNKQWVEVTELIALIFQQSPSTQIVLLTQSVDPTQLYETTRRVRIFKTVHSYEDANFETVLLEALEFFARLKQDHELYGLFRQQNLRLVSLSQELEERVQQRQKYFESARERLHSTANRLESLHTALIAIHRSNSIGEMESRLTETFKPAFELNWIRITFENQSHLEEAILAESQALSLLILPLKRDQPSGKIFFARRASTPFRGDDEDFLIKVTEAVALAVERLAQLEKQESLKSQWDTTFDSISRPLALISADHDLIRVNIGYANAAGTHPAKLIGGKCYQKLFGKSAPCSGCELGASFQLLSTTAHDVGTRSGQRTIQVVSTRIEPPDKDHSIFVNLYTDITERLILERKIVETAKSAELGLIGGSIAHELNNPMAGIITFLQLLRMDLKGNETYADDVREMERGALKCKDIIENLLSFARKDEEGIKEPIDLRDVLKRAFKLVELKSKSSGIRIIEDIPEREFQIMGSRNLLVQAMVNLLQASMERIFVRRKKLVSDFDPFIRISLLAIADSFKIVILDNGDMTRGASRNAGLGITVAHHIFHDHLGTVETRSAESNETATEITLQC